MSNITTPLSGITKELKTKMLVEVRNQLQAIEEKNFDKFKDHVKLMTDMLVVEIDDDEEAAQINKALENVMNLSVDPDKVDWGSYKNLVKMFEGVMILEIANSD